ncbi:TPA: hypothetical protein PR959_002837, partial [Staphylococcus aureus]|nr:hypothetical protein [Staphylococcus aureus]
IGRMMQTYKVSFSVVYNNGSPLMYKHNQKVKVNNEEEARTKTIEKMHKKYNKHFNDVHIEIEEVRSK